MLSTFAFFECAAGKPKSIMSSSFALNYSGHALPLWVQIAYFVYFDNAPSFASKYIPRKRGHLRVITFVFVYTQLSVSEISNVSADIGNTKTLLHTAFAHFLIFYANGQR